MMLRLSETVVTVGVLLVIGWSFGAVLGHEVSLRVLRLLRGRDDER